ncbi:homoserine kinase [Actinomadura litoris]|uniref:Homoserine kinase n=1 Tax=Actinomadura litoris TaxID=2678616 RepID=A0A7K1KXK1_9ACTN|nr:homoserine kinase [Actinomadura litoris]MUN36932.1 homoserine kinase [Actinomadura litoris]
MSWPNDPVLVRTPATSANLGPGFDSLGLALSLFDDVEVAVTGEELSIEVDGEGAEVADRGERHLIVKVLRHTFDVLDELSAAEGAPIMGQPKGIRLRCRNRIPHSRGLGSSSAAIVAGIVAARALHPGGKLLGDEGAFRLATEHEGHPDNVAPCLAGGLTIAWTGAAGPRLVRLKSRVGHVIAFVPEQRLATERARGLLPETVPHGDAAANAGRAALLIAALTAGLDPTVLLDATEDRLHQDYRAPAMPDSAALVARLRAAGVPAVISGAGPTVLAFTTASQVDSMGPEVGNGWHEHPLDVATRGARVMAGEAQVRH